MKLQSLESMVDISDLGSKCMILSSAFGPGIFIEFGVRDRQVSLNKVHNESFVVGWVFTRFQIVNDVKQMLLESFSVIVQFCGDGAKGVELGDTVGRGGHIVHVDIVNDVLKEKDAARLVVHVVTHLVVHDGNDGVVCE